MLESVISNDIFHKFFMDFPAVANVSFEIFGVEHVYLCMEVFHVWQCRDERVLHENFANVVDMAEEVFCGSAGCGGDDWVPVS